MYHQYNFQFNPGVLMIQGFYMGKHSPKKLLENGVVKNLQSRIEKIKGEKRCTIYDFEVSLKDINGFFQNIHSFLKLKEYEEIARIKNRFSDRNLNSLVQEWWESYKNTYHLLYVISRFCPDDYLRVKYMPYMVALHIPPIIKLQELYMVADEYWVNMSEPRNIDRTTLNQVISDLYDIL